jgi:hypothetical protein
MKIKPLVLVALGTVLVVVLAGFSPRRMIAPGDTIDAHAELAADCFACHTPFAGSTPSKCVVCHRVAEIGIKTTKGLLISKEKKNVAFHQRLLEYDCVACHSDHSGVKAFRPISQFSHQLVQPGLREQCGSCHARPGDSLHVQIKGSCKQCHTQAGWLPATFDHAAYFRFDRHHRADCKVCHVGNVYSAYTCYGCHEHSRSKIRHEHVEERIYDYETCVKCHRSGDEHEAKRIWRSLRDGTRDSRPFGSEGSRRHRGHRHDDDDDDDD